MSDITTDTALLREIGAEIRLLNHRLGTLESLVGGIGHEIGDLKVEVAELRGRVGQLPTWWMMPVAIVTIFAAAYGLLHLPGPG